MTEQNQDKTFTQEDVNRIVSERLAEEKKRIGAELDKREQDLAKRELMYTARDRAREMGIPENILDTLRFEDEESLTKALESIKPYIAKLNETPADPEPMATISTGGRATEPALGGAGGDPAIRRAFGL